MRANQKHGAGLSHVKSVKLHDVGETGDTASLLDEVLIATPELPDWSKN